MAERAISFRESGEAPAVPVATPRARARRWSLLRRALTARGAPFGGAVLIVAGRGGVVIALRVVYTPPFARLMRGQVLTVRTREYVEAARVLGSPGWRIVRQHVLPNVATPIVVQASLSIAFAILAEASLSFLGLGVAPPAPSWGGMINQGRGYLQQAPWIVFGPGAALFVTVLGLNFVGDAIRDALDPRIRV